MRRERPPGHPDTRDRPKADTLDSRTCRGCLHAPIMLSMSTPHRIVLVERPAVAERTGTHPRVRHYRLARLRLAQQRQQLAPRHAHLRETYD